MPTPTIPFEILGHFEEIIDIETGKCYGTRPVDYPIEGESIISKCKRNLKGKKTPPYGWSGRVERLFKKGEVIIIDKAHKGLQPYKFKADAKCYVMTHPLCGRMK